MTMKKKMLPDFVAIGPIRQEQYANPPKEQTEEAGEDEAPPLAPGFRMLPRFSDPAAGGTEGGNDGAGNDGRDDRGRDGGRDTGGGDGAEDDHGGAIGNGGGEVGGGDNSGGSNGRPDGLGSNQVQTAVNDALAKKVAEQDDAKLEPALAEQTKEVKVELKTALSDAAKQTQNNLEKLLADAESDRKEWFEESLGKALREVGAVVRKALEDRPRNEGLDQPTTGPAAAQEPTTSVPVATQITTQLPSVDQTTIREGANHGIAPNVTCSQAVAPQTTAQLPFVDVGRSTTDILIGIQRLQTNPPSTAEGYLEIPFDECPVRAEDNTKC